MVGLVCVWLVVAGVCCGCWVWEFEWGSSFWSWCLIFCSCFDYCGGFDSLDLLCLVCWFVGLVFAGILLILSGGFDKFDALVLVFN